VSVQIDSLQNTTSSTHKIVNIADTLLHLEDSVHLAEDLTKKVKLDRHSQQLILGRDTIESKISHAENSVREKSNTIQDNVTKSTADVKDKLGDDVKIPTPEMPVQGEALNLPETNLPGLNNEIS